MTVARTTRRKTASAEAVATLDELNAPHTSAPAPEEAPASSAPSAPSADASPASDASAPTATDASPTDAFACIAPGGPTLFEAMDGPRPRRWLVAADGIGVSAAWDAWRVDNPTGAADAFIAQLGRALGDAPGAVTALSVVRVRLRGPRPSRSRARGRGRKRLKAPGPSSPSETAAPARTAQVQ